MSDSPEGPSDHLVRLRQGWTAWRAIVLRSAGFPASRVLQLAATRSCAAIDQLLALQEAAGRAREAAIAAVEQAYDGEVGERRSQRRKALHRLRAGQLAELADGGVQPALAALRDADARCLAQRQVVDDVFGQDGRRISEAIRALAADPVFHEALVWQNRTLIETMLEPLLRTPLGASDARTRHKESTVASYGQRYCVKNDTIGFFGPVGWARLGDADDVLQIRPGATLLDVRRVHFEFWGIDALAAKLAEDPELRLDLAPRRLPTVRIDGQTVHYPIARSTQLAPEYLAVLVACDGETSARALARAVSRDPALGVSEDDVYDLLAELVEQRLVRWTLEIPTAGQEPERHLRRALDGLAPSAARDRALATLAQIDAARAAVARAAGDPVALDRALRAFDDLFSQLTGLTPTRRAGQMYAGRTLIYEETHRNVELELGARFMAQLGPPLTLVMLSARWYTHAVATAYRPVFRQVYDELRARTGHAAVDYLQYLEHILPHLAEQDVVAPTVKPVVAELQRRWLELLGVTPDVRRIARSADELRAQVEAVFAAPGPGWTQARYHSPDIMIAAAGVDAMRRGELMCVINEIHVGVHTYTRPLFLNLHPDPEALLRDRRRELGRPVIATVEARANALRSDHFPPVPDDIDIEASDARSWRAREHVIDVAQLVVEALDGQLVVRTRDQRQTFDIVEVFEAYLQLASETLFTLLPPLPHAPRTSIDGLVVTRETWWFEPAQLAFATLGGIDRFIAARAWAQRHGLPRFVFLRIPEEAKPCFVDLESPHYVESLARLVRKASKVALSEMLPGLDQTWLVDAEGNTYTSELRMALVDPEPWRPPA
ncbi:MAG: lantibiotic dehydratase [Kofleriaceae bacterium]